MRAIPEKMNYKGACEWRVGTPNYMYEEALERWAKEAEQQLKEMSQQVAELKDFKSAVITATNVTELTELVKQVLNK